MSFGFWPAMIRKDDLIVDSINFVLSVFYGFRFRENSILRRMKSRYKASRSGEEIFIVLNGPSIVGQDLNLLKGKNVMFVNRGFMHPLFAEISPDFHVFVDPKMISGEWSIEWLDEILSMVPDITFVLPVNWYFEPKLKPYVERGIRILWIPNRSPLLNLGVAGKCFEVSAFLGFSYIYFTGFDGNGLAYELINGANSHFYGINEENTKKTSSDFARDLYMNSRHFSDLIRLSRRLDKRGVKIYNLTMGGVIDMFERRKWEEFFKS